MAEFGAGGHIGGMIGEGELGIGGELPGRNDDGWLKFCRQKYLALEPIGGVDGPVWNSRHRLRSLPLSFSYLLFMMLYSCYY